MSKDKLKEEQKDMGYVLGIGGAVTYSESSELQDIVKRVPLESIVLETDSPYVIPEERETTMNARRLFGI